MSAARRLETVGPTKPAVLYPRWRFTLKNGVTWETTGRAQYVFGALAMACDEGLARLCLDQGFAYPTMGDVDVVHELPEPTDAERVDASVGRIA